MLVRLVVAAAVIDALASLGLQSPEAGAERCRELAVVKERLEKSAWCSKYGW